MNKLRVYGALFILVCLGLAVSMVERHEPRRVPPPQTPVSKRGDELARKLWQAERWYLTRAPTPTPEPTMPPELRRRTLGPTLAQALRAPGPWPPRQWKPAGKPRWARRWEDGGAEFPWVKVPSQEGRLSTWRVPAQKPAAAPPPRQAQARRLRDIALAWSRGPGQLSPLQREMPVVALSLVPRDLRGTVLDGYGVSLHLFSLTLIGQSLMESAAHTPSPTAEPWLRPRPVYRPRAQLTVQVFADDAEARRAIYALHYFSLREAWLRGEEATFRGRPVGDEARWLVLALEPKGSRGREPHLLFRCANVCAELSVRHDRLSPSAREALACRLAEKLCARVRTLRAWAEAPRERAKLFGKSVPVRRLGPDLLVARLSDLARAAGLVFTFSPAQEKLMARQLELVERSGRFAETHHSVGLAEHVALATPQGQRLVFAVNCPEIAVAGKTLATRFPNLRVSYAPVAADLLVDVNGFLRALGQVPEA